MASLIPEQSNRSAIGLERAVWVAKILFLLIGITSTIVAVAQLAFPNLLTLLSSPSQLHYKFWNSAAFSTNNCLFITVHFIIVVVWKLHTNQMPESPPVSTPPTHQPHRPSSSENDHVEGISSRDQPCSEDICSTADFVTDAVENMRVAEQLSWASPETECDDYSNSLDATWKAIMEGRSWSTGSNNQVLKKADLPISEFSVDWRDFRKSETFKEPSSAEKDGSESKNIKEMRKSKTFNDGSSNSNVGWRWRDVLVVSHDELFGKAEAFLKMNYDQMRLQRQESEQRRRHEAMMMLNAKHHSFFKLLVMGGEVSKTGVYVSFDVIIFMQIADCSLCLFFFQLVVVTDL